MYTAAGVSYNGCQNALAPAFIVILLHCQKDTSVKHTITCIAIICTLFCLTISCQRSCEPPHRGIYHWKTTYDPTEWELQFIKDHHIDRLYIRLFDVVGIPYWDAEYSLEPSATTCFRQPLPADIEVVPVVFVTNDAVSQLNGRGDCERYAQLIVERTRAMMLCQGQEEFRWLQIDCDWAMGNREKYVLFCDVMDSLLDTYGIGLDVTVRLFQLKEKTLLPQSADNLTLMAYNTGNLRDFGTRNAILDYNDAEPYLRMAGRIKGMGSVAYPVFGWGVAFDENGKFSHLTLYSELATAESNDTLRIERGEMLEIRKVQERIAEISAKSECRTTILYHLDSLNLANYTHDEIEKIFGR